MSLGVGLCWGLFMFDLVLGTVCVFRPDVYLDIFHPTLDTPQVELIRRTGVLWLVFAAVAARAATVVPARRAAWFLVLAVLRLMDVPADALYAVTASGASVLSRALLWSAPPLNMAMGGYLYWLAWAQRRSTS